MPCGGLRAAGLVGGRPRGVGLPPLSGASAVRRCPSPGRPSLGAGSQGSAARVSQVRLVWAWGPSTGPQCAVLRAVVARCGGGGRASPGGGALRCYEGRLGSAALPPPAARPLGGLSGSAAHVLWARVCGRGCAICPWGGRPGLGVCGVCGACAVFVCWWERGGAMCAVVLLCVVLPPSVSRPDAPLSCATPWCCGCRGLWLCPLPRARPSCGCWLCVFFLLRCGALYPFLYSPLVCPPPWRAFFPASLAFLCVFRHFSLPASSCSGSSYSTPS